MAEHAQHNLNCRVALIPLNLPRLQNWGIQINGNNECSFHCDASNDCGTKLCLWKFNLTRSACMGSRSVTRNMAEDFGPTT